MKYKINSNNGVEDFVLNIRENFKANTKVLYDQRNIIKLFEINGKQYVVKSFRTPHLFNRIVYSFFRKSKAERSYINTKKLESLNIGTPSPVAYIEFYSSFLIKESFYISEYFDFDYQMSDALYNENFDDRDSIFKQFAKFTYEIHNKGVFHSDYNHGNILFKNNKGIYEFSLVDVNRMKFMTLNDNLRMKSMCRLTRDVDTLKIIVKYYCAIPGKNFDHLMNLLTNHLKRFNKHQNNKKLLKKYLFRIANRRL
jgi:tRNA A-37 threonylcarbamoyl transferase component Bud32